MILPPRFTTTFLVEDSKQVIVILDSDHTLEHVLTELRFYAKFVSSGSYLIVFDTLIESIPERFNKGKPWGPGNNPGSAVNVFLDECADFCRHGHYEEKAMITAAPGGVLKRIR